MAPTCHLSWDCDTMDSHAVFMDNPKFLVSPEAGPSVPAEDENFGSILSAFEQQHHGNGHGQAVQGTVVSIGPENVIVDIGRKMDGVLPLDACKDASGVLTVKVGDSIPVSITGRDEEGSYLL